MSEVIDLVPEEGVQNERTACMISAVNENHRRAARAEEKKRMAGQARIRELEAEAAARRERVWMLVHTVVGAAVILAGIYFLRGVGAVHGALAEVFALVTVFGAGRIIGQTAKEGSV